MVKTKEDKRAEKIFEEMSKMAEEESGKGGYFYNLRESLGGDDAAEEFEKLIKGFKTGKLDPTKIGKPVNWVKLDKKLICPGCKSQNVEWLLDKNSKEVYFHCLKCNESFWMTLKEYDKNIKKNPDKIV